MEYDTHLRQRLLYLHARTPSVFSAIIGYTPIEPVKGYRTEISAEECTWPYETVHDAIVDGYHIVELDLPAGLNEQIAQQLDALEANPSDAIIEAIPELGQVLEHPAVRGVLTSLLGQKYAINSHRHWHCKLPGSPYMHWHQESTNNRNTEINRFLGLYYPRTITPDMGPAMIVPGTQFRNAPTDRMATYTNIRGQLPLTVQAGTVAFTHYDLWHGTAANRSSMKRHMIKFLFNRTQENTTPTWNHDPEALNKLRDWNLRDKAEDVNNILSFVTRLVFRRVITTRSPRSAVGVGRNCWGSQISPPSIEP